MEIIKSRLDTFVVFRKIYLYPISTATMSEIFYLQQRCKRSTNRGVCSVVDFDKSGRGSY